MRPLAILAVLAGLALPASSAAATPTSATAALQRPPLAGGATKQASTTSTAPVSVPLSDTPPAGRRLSPNQALAIAGALPKIKAARAKYRGSFGGTYLKSPLRWQVSFFSSNGKKEIGQVFIDDVSGRVLEQWTGFQVPWSMARGYPGAFGRHVNALYVWLPLCVLFALPFFNFRRPLSLTNLDLLALLSFSVSLAFFNHANIWASVPAVYPPLLYLLARMLALLRRGRAPARDAATPLRLLVPVSWLAIAVVFLVGFRVALNVTDANVIDVGYAGVIGAQRITHDRPLYGSYPSDNERGDTYGPFNYEAYVPFQQLFGWSGTWDDLPAAHAAAIAFDLLSLALLFWLGRRMRGPTLGVVLAYAWVTYPFTLYSLESNSNDSLVALVLIAALLSATYRSRLAPACRGALTALAGLTKFAPLALAPVLATHELIGQRQLPLSRRALAVALFALGFLAAAAIALVPALTHDSLHTIYERTIAYQANRGSPFSVWGLYGGLGGVQLAVQIAAVALAVALALIPRRADLVGLAAACAAVMIAVELGIEHWFYLYIPWFFPLVIVALLGRFGEPARRRPAEASSPARSTRRVAALST
jgi:hypothetical protein